MDRADARSIESNRKLINPKTDCFDPFPNLNPHLDGGYYESECHVSAQVKNPNRKSFHNAPQKYTEDGRMAPGSYRFYIFIFLIK